MRGSHRILALGLAGLFVIAPFHTASADAVLPLAIDTRAPVETAALAPPTKTSTQSSPQESASPSLFGLATQAAPAGALWRKWHVAQAGINASQPTLERCLRDFRRCSVAARSLRTIIKQASFVEGRERLAIVNRGVNAAITYKADIDQWQRADVWSTPLESSKTGSFETGVGDCEDYAIAKFVALRTAGTASADLKILMVEDTTARIHHAALAARVDGQWVILDNRWSRLLDTSETSFFKPLYALSDLGVERFIAPNVRMVHLKTRKPLAPV